MSVQIATGKDLKRVSVTLNHNGSVTKGSIHEVLAGNVTAGVGNTDSVAEEAGVVKEEEKE
jgi:hypothetical protein